MLGRRYGNMWIIFAYLVLIGALGTITYFLLAPTKPATSELTTYIDQANEGYLEFQATGEMAWDERAEAEITPYDPHTNRPRVGPPRMPAKMTPPKTREKRPIAFRVPDNRGRNPCRRDCNRRPTPAPNPADCCPSPTPDPIPESVGMKRTTLPISSQP